MRRLIAVTAVLILAVILGACGGGGGEQAAPPATDDGSVPPPPPVAAAADAAAPDRSPTEAVGFEAFPAQGQLATVTPAVILDNLKAKRAMLIFFYDRSQPEWDDAMDVVSGTMDDYRGLLELVSFDMQKAADPKGLAKDAELGKAVMLAERLGVKNTPYILIVDDQGLITWRWRGPVDAGALERELMRATQ